MIPGKKYPMFRLKHNQLIDKYVTIYNYEKTCGPYYIVAHKVFRSGKLGGIKSIIAYKFNKDDTETHQQMFPQNTMAVIQSENNEKVKDEDNELVENDVQTNNLSLE